MLKTIDLFAGAGGLSLGFKQTGHFKLVAAAEIKKYARETYSHNIPNPGEEFVFIENVVGYDFRTLSRRFGGIDVVIGGPPCQGFSNANRQKTNLISMNNALVKEYFRAIKEIKPRAFVMENVSMLKSNVHRFYDSCIDHDLIKRLNETSADPAKPLIPMREDKIIMSSRNYEGFDLKAIEQHFFFGYGARRSLTRNALSRLWWIGRLTYDNEREYELTKFVCENADNIMHILERNTSNNPDIVKAFISAVIDAKSTGKQIDTNDIGELSKYLNLLGGTYILDCLPSSVIYDKIYKKAIEI